jgi:hypothetical protein
MLNYRVIISFVLFGSMLGACESTSFVSPPVPDWTIQNMAYPTVGQGIVYDVIETEYTILGQVITQKYQIKESAQGVFKDSQGQESIRLERFRRVNEQQEWKIDSVWVARITTDKMLKTENNQTFVKLTLPFAENSRWDGNIFNNTGKENYTMKRVGDSFVVKEKKYGPSVTVFARNDSTLVSQDKRYEIFAFNVGMVYKEKTNLAFCSRNDCLGKGKIDFGKKITFTINSLEK